MCWRDNVVTTRFCSSCGQEYYGDLGHRGCPGPRKPQVAKPQATAPTKKATTTEEPPF